MKRLSTTPNLCVRQHAQSLCALPFYKPRLSTFSTLVLVEGFALSSLFHLSVSSAVLCRTAPAHLHTHLPSIEFA